MKGQCMTVFHRVERKVSHSRQKSILFDTRSYTAFPHVIRLDDRELLIAFRQAPRTEEIHHAHPASVVTVMRSRDGGISWDREWATQVGAGGGQELGLMYMGSGRVAGVLAWQEVVHSHDAVRGGVPQPFPTEYPFRTPGTYWIESDNWGLTWRPDRIRLVGMGTMPCAAPVMSANGMILLPVYTWDDKKSPMESVLYRSIDEGHIWSEPIIMARDREREYGEPCLVELEPGHLRAMYRVETEKGGTDRCFWTNESHDGGLTWSVPVNTGILSGACPRVLKLRDRRLLLTFGRRFEPYGIRAMLSADGGLTWGDEEWILRPGCNGDLGYTSSVELDDGQVLTTTYMQNARGITGIVGTFWHP